MPLKWVSGSELGLPSVWMYTHFPSVFHSHLFSLDCPIGIWQNAGHPAKEALTQCQSTNNMLLRHLYSPGVEEQRIISPTDADRMILQSIGEIEKRSDRLGQLAKYINDARIRNTRR